MGCLEDFGELCTLGVQSGWHERNGGNLSYRMTLRETAQLCDEFAVIGDGDEPAGSADAGTRWRDIGQGVRVPGLGGEFFLVTGTGRYLRYVEQDIRHNAGIVEIDEAGGRYRVVWGLCNEAGEVGACAPTSEFAGHLLLHDARKHSTGGAARVAYHCHPVDVVALSKAIPLDERAFTRTLWKAHTECVIMFPEGMGVVGCQVPGSMELAIETKRCMQRYRAAVWAHHGLFVTGESFQDAFGLAEVVVKAAGIYRAACQMNGGPEFGNTITDGDLRAIADAWGIAANPDFL